MKSIKHYSKKALISITILLLTVMIIFVSLTQSVNSASVGWQKEGNGWRYINNEGMYITNRWSKIGDRWYHFSQTGYMQRGWLKDNDRWYYLGSPDNPDLGAMATGWRQLESKWYYFGTNGAMKRGWQKIEGAWYYLGSPDNPDLGAMSTGWRQIDGKWYYFGTNGAMKRGWQKIDAKWYYLGSSDNPDLGAMRHGWLQLDENWYYLGWPENPNSGIMRTGLVNTNPDASGTPQYYYLGTSGVWLETYTGPAIENDSGNIYHVINGGVQENANGSFSNSINNYSYTGSRITGVTSVGDRHVYLESGVPVGNKAINIGGEYYRSDANGNLATGWYTDNGKQRYYDENTFKAVRDVTVEKLYINANAEVTEAARLASAVLDEVGWDLRAAYDWCIDKPYATEYGDISTRGTTALAKEFFVNKKGNCYKYSAAFWYLAKTLEYSNIKHVHGTINEGIRHGWCEVTEDGVVYVFDPTGDIDTKDGRGFHTTKANNKAYTYNPQYQEVPLDV